MSETGETRLKNASQYFLFSSWILLKAEKIKGVIVTLTTALLLFWFNIMTENYYSVDKFLLKLSCVKFFFLYKYFKDK